MGALKTKELEDVVKFVAELVNAIIALRGSFGVFKSVPNFWNLWRKFEDAKDGFGQALLEWDDLDKEEKEDLHKLVVREVKAEDAVVEEVAESVVKLSLELITVYQKVSGIFRKKPA